MKTLIILIVALLMCWKSTAQLQYIERQALIESRIESLEKLICKEVADLIIDSDYDAFMNQRLNVGFISDSCLEKLTEFYRQTNPLYYTHLKFNLYKDMGFGPELNDYLRSVDDMFRLALYEKLNNKRITILTRKSLTYSLDKIDYYNSIHDSIKKSVYIEGTYIPENLEEALILALEILDDEDLNRIDSYKDNEECYWGELDLSAKNLLDKWFLMTSTRLTTNFYDNYYPEDIRFWRANGFFVSGLIIVAIKNRNNKEFDIRKFIKGFELKIPIHPYTKPVRGEIYEFIVD